METDTIKIHFLGAAGSVTGSKYLLDTGDRKILVDCGLFQGLKELRLKNWEYPPVNVNDIDVILLTHGHMDHTGYLPRLVKQGFKGPIYGTYPTLDIAKIILNDSAKIQEQEAQRANKEGYSKHSPAEPLYDLKDVEQTIPHFKAIPQSQWIPLFDGIKARFQYNGHILGATFIELDVHGKRFVFSGDIGRTNDLLLYPPLKPKKADVLFMESTYGGRFHPEEAEAIPQIEKLVNETIDKGGSLFIPSFSVERAQLMMLIFWRLLKENKIPKVQMIMDSPMGANVLELFHRTRDWHRLEDNECDEMCSHFTVVSSYRETMELRTDNKPKIVIAGSGMLTGGRMLNYLETQAQNPNNTLLLVGYQAEGTRGRKLLEGEKELKVYGKTVTFKMQLAEIEGLSAHADHAELLDWLSDVKEPPEKLFIVHGEKEGAEALKQGIKETYGWESEIPQLYGIEEIK
ncbi:MULTISPECIES: MBL fold metallo-hydrolase RNA specificity domain-containing protein [Arenibacter]|jgi:metallo-beta-lactamase family protein|uniref:Ribonuclease n=1 Tax=Arenibacter algicola TaxID=616991 RepID=A0A221UWP3_9FLAO|nr:MULTISPECIES: MBL fold metallo-hydrolase [Arenibacter]ASO05787.1 ribonuclease [Arenibacter algicola]MCM4164875.1 MBL fold metallo-hydrolase [Arenibacter sp. A80]RFT55290.1 MBL fold metallo-hydrolase [Arenibacter sp. P308M17]|tara:strand:- start:10386 stop:11762 length:1377 start_codon:yes stop_codon:yes gene_type:complete